MVYRIASRGQLTYLANDVDSAWASTDEVRRLAVCVFERREQVVPSCGLRLQCVPGVDVGERGLGWYLHCGIFLVMWYPASSLIVPLGSWISCVNASSFSLATQNQKIATPAEQSRSRRSFSIYMPLQTPHSKGVISSAPRTRFTLHLPRPLSAV